ncbi:hypothetical protein QMN21_27840, partial [Serratia sp. Se-PFBMAAmG]|nr:hypothetical protein [Serratia sp. Se-PFBMAAmG]
QGLLRINLNRHRIVIGLSWRRARIAAHYGDFLVTLEYAMLVLFLPASAGIFLSINPYWIDEERR